LDADGDGSTAATMSGASARTRVSANHQVTIPLGPYEAAELEVGDHFRVDSLGPGRILLTRVKELARQYAATLFDAG